MGKSRNIKILLWSDFFLDFRPYAVIAVIYFAKIAGSYALGLSIFSAIMIASSVLELPTGILSDYVGRRMTVILGAFASVLSLVFYALGVSFWILIIGSCFAGLSRAFFSGNNSALLYESLEGNEDDFAEMSGKISSMSQIGLATSALIGGLIAFKSFSLVFWLSVIPQVVVLCLSFALVEPRIHKNTFETNIFSHLKDSFAGFKRSSKLRVFTLASALQYGIEETLYDFAPAFIAMLWPTWALGIIRSANNFIASASFWFSGKVIKKLSALKAAIIGNLSNRFFGILATAFPTVVSPLLLTCSEVFYGVLTTAQDVLLQNEFSDKQRATMGSLSSFMSSISFAVFAFLFGLIADKIGPARSLLIGQILLLFVIFLYWTVFRKERRIASTTQ